MRAALDIAIKDLRQRARDRSALLIGIVAPFVLAILFANMLGDVDGQFHAEWGLVDGDGGELATALVEGPIAGLEEAGVVTVTMFDDRAAAEAAVDDGTVRTAVVIPAGFTDAATSGGGGSIEIITNPDATISAQVARSVLSSFTSRIDAVGLAVTTALIGAGELPDPATIEALSAQARDLADPITIAADAADAREASTSTYYAAAMAILFVFLGAQFGVTSLLTEKRTKTLSRIVAAPVRPFAIVAGKTIVSMTLAIVSMSIIVLGTALLLGATWGDPVALAALIIAAALAATGVALLAVSFARSEDQAGSIVAIVTLSLAVLGGSFFPTSQGPELMAMLSQLTPHQWFLTGVGDISSGGDIVSASTAIGILAAIGLLTGGIGMWRARGLVVS